MVRLFFGNEWEVYDLPAKRNSVIWSTVQSGPVNPGCSQGGPQTTHRLASDPGGLPTPWQTWPATLRPEARHSEPPAHTVLAAFGLIIPQHASASPDGPARPPQAMFLAGALESKALRECILSLRRGMRSCKD